METVTVDLASERKSGGCFWIGLRASIVLFVSLIFVIYFGLGPISFGPKQSKGSVGMQKARAIVVAMFQYAQDHDGAYPDGKSSTEIFQKLIDEKYISDSAIFYIPMPGKTKPTSNKLSADNVCFDVTSRITPGSPDELPIIFSTGYTVIYLPGGAALRDKHSEAPFGNEGVAVAYKSNSAMFKKASENGDVPLFIPETFNPGNETYKQLRP